MGPVSELDMVKQRPNCYLPIVNAFILGILNGLLFPTILARPTLVLSGPYKVPVAVNKDAGKDLATRHILLQREKFLCAHNNGAQQVIEDQSGWGYPVFNEVNRELRLNIRSDQIV